MALSDNVVVTLTAQAKPKTDDKCRHSKQSHVVPFGLAEPGNSTLALPMATALTQHQSSTHYCCPLNALTVGPVRKLTPKSFKWIFFWWCIKYCCREGHWETSCMSMPCCNAKTIPLSLPTNQWQDGMDEPWEQQQKPKEKVYILSTQGLWFGGLVWKVICHTVAYI